MAENVTTLEIEIAVARLFNKNGNMVVPNVSWGLGLHECDVLIVRKSGAAIEVEIKINRYDLKRDSKKPHGHRSKRIGRLFFAIPKSLLEFKEYIPEHAGIIVYDKYFIGEPCHIERPAKANKSGRLFTQEEMVQLGRLGCLRIWSLKNQILYRENYQCPITDELI